MKTDTEKKILSFIKKRKKARPHDLIRFLALSPAAIHKQLKKLIGKGLLQKKGSSPLSFYVISYKKNDIKRSIKTILKKHGVKKASLFGSFARNEAGKESDVDILVDYPRGKSLYDFIELKLKLEEILNKKVDLVEFDSINPLLKERILQEQIPLL